MHKPTSVKGGQTWIWKPKRPKAGEDKEVTVDRLTVPTPQFGKATVDVTCLEYKLDPSGANLVHFRDHDGKAVDKVMLTSDEWWYLRG